MSNTPKKLRLEFSRAADYDRVNVFFDPVIKSKIDPMGYVAPRLEADFRKAVNGGNAAFLSAENGDVMTLVVNYHVNKDDTEASAAQHDHTELGTTISRLQGYHSGNLVASAIALKEWFMHPPKGLFMTEIKHDNTAPQKIYKALGWEPVTGDALIEELIEVAYKTCPEDAPIGEDRKKIGYYHCPDKAIAVQAGIVLKFMDAGGVVNPKTGHFIPVDFSELESVGLTRPRLEALAKGVLNRDLIKKIVPQSP